MTSMVMVTEGPGSSVELTSYVFQVARLRLEYCLVSPCDVQQHV